MTKEQIMRKAYGPTGYVADKPTAKEIMEQRFPRRYAEEDEVDN